jgi:hypothetical protein
MKPTSFNLENRIKQSLANKNGLLQPRPQGSVGNAPTAPSTPNASSQTAASAFSGAKPMSASIPPNSKGPLLGQGGGGLGSSANQSTKGKPELLDNGFTKSESSLLHEALQLSNFKWFDGDGVILGKVEQFDLTFRAGQSSRFRWAVMAFPIYDMNQPNSAEICLHFLAEAYEMIHQLDFQYQVGINMETEKLEFLMQLPIDQVTGSQLAELIKAFFQALSETVAAELSGLLERLESQDA